MKTIKMNALLLKIISILKNKCHNQKFIIANYQISDHKFNNKKNTMNLFLMEN